jgi:hypothetical protein
LSRVAGIKLHDSIGGPKRAQSTNSLRAIAMLGTPEVACRC